MRVSREKTLLNQRGVTLVELMIVMAVLAVLAGFAGPAIFRAAQRERSMSYAREMANVFRRARNAAMNRGTVMAVYSTSNWIAIWEPSSQAGTRSCQALASAGSWTVREHIYLNRSPLMQVHYQSHFFYCFSPDGRIMNTMTPGRPPNASAAYVCDSGGALIVVGSKEATSAEKAAGTNCNGDKDLRDGGMMYRILIPYNGAVGVKQ